MLIKDNENGRAYEYAGFILRHFSMFFPTYYNPHLTWCYPKKGSKKGLFMQMILAPGLLHINISLWFCGRYNGRPVCNPRGFPDQPVID